MKITTFKEGDIITRSEPAPNGDRSYQCEKLQLIGVDVGMIVLIDMSEEGVGRIIRLGTDWWSDGWDYFPQGLINKAIAQIKKLLVPPPQSKGNN